MVILRDCCNYGGRNIRGTLTFGGSHWSGTGEPRCWFLKRLNSHNEVDNMRFYLEFLFSTGQWSGSLNYQRLFSSRSCQWQVNRYQDHPFNPLLELENPCSKTHATLSPWYIQWVWKGMSQHSFPICVTPKHLIHACVLSLSLVTSHNQI